MVRKHCVQNTVIWAGTTPHRALDAAITSTYLATHGQTVIMMENVSPND